MCVYVYVCICVYMHASYSTAVRGLPLVHSPLEQVRTKQILSARLCYSIMILQRSIASWLLVKIQSCLSWHCLVWLNLLSFIFVPHPNIKGKKIWPCETTHGRGDCTENASLDAPYS